MESQLPVIAIFGPTASGKSAVAAAVAERVGGALISADAMQVYRGLPILTNQPHEPTSLVGIWPLDHEASVGEYAPIAHNAIDEALAAGRTPIVVGGTGLYLRAALADLDIPPPAPPGVRERFESLYDRDGGVAAHSLLSDRDPGAAAGVHVNDRRRVVRALELVELGRTLRPDSDALWTDASRHPTVIVGLDVGAELLAERIASRTGTMLALGARDEARRALASPISETALKVIGLREAAELPEAEALEAISDRTRRYAAYQQKWMRRIPNVMLVTAAVSPSVIADEVLQMARAG